MTRPLALVLIFGLNLQSVTIQQAASIGSLISTGSPILLHPKVRFIRPIKKELARLRKKKTK